MNSEQQRRGIFFSGDPTEKIIGPTPRDRQRADKLSSEELSDQSGKVSKRVALGLGGTAVLIGTGGTVFAVNAVQGEKVRDIGSVPGGTSFSNDGSVPQLEGLSPQLQNPTSINQEPTNPVNPAEVSSSRNNTPQSVGETKKVNPEKVKDPRGAYNPDNKGEQTIRIGSDTRPISKEEKQLFLSTSPVLEILLGELQPRATIMLPGNNLPPGGEVKVQKIIHGAFNGITNKEEDTMFGFDFIYSNFGIKLSLSFIPGIGDAKKIEVYQKTWLVKGEKKFAGIYAEITMPDADGTRLGVTIIASEDVGDIRPLIDNLPILDSDPKSVLARREGKYTKRGLDITQDPELPLLETAREGATIGIIFGGLTNIPGLEDFAFKSALATDDSNRLLRND